MALKNVVPDKAPVPIGKTVLDIGVRHQVYLERLKTHLSEEVQVQLDKFESKVTRWLADHTQDLSELTHTQAQELISQARQQQMEALLQSVDGLMTQLSDVAGYEAEFTAKTLAKISEKVKIKTLEADKAFKAALKKPIPATGELLDSFIQDWTKKEVSAVGNLISKGYTNGWTNQQIIQSIRGTKAADYADGIMARVGRNADAVVKTAVQHVANTARAETWAKNSDIIQWVRVVATLDENTTPTCRFLDGKRFKLGEEPQFPIHVRCRTTTVAELDPEFEYLQEGATRSSASGYVDAKMSYYDWLKTQDNDFQDDALGATRGQLFRKGGLTPDEFARLNVSRNFQPMTLDQMRKKEPDAFKQAGL